MISDGPGRYATGSNCSWRIGGGGVAAKIVLSIFEFDTEAGYDFLRVYDGASGRLVASFDGAYYGTQLVETRGEMLVAFTSDATVSAAGFQANYAVFSQ